MDFWTRLKTLIKKENTTQEWVASKINVSYRTFNGWISRKIIPNADQAVSIAKVLGTTVEYLVTGDIDDSGIQEINYIKKYWNEDYILTDTIKTLLQLNRESLLMVNGYIHGKVNPEEKGWSEEKSS